MRHCIAWFLAALSLTGIASAAETIARGDLAKLTALIKPGPGEDKWSEIPWLTDL